MTLYKSAANLSLGEAAQKAFEIAKKSLQPGRVDVVDEGKLNADKIAKKDAHYLELTKKANDAFFKGKQKLAQTLFAQRDKLYQSLVDKNAFLNYRKNKMHLKV